MSTIRAKILRLMELSPVREGVIKAAMDDYGYDWLKISRELGKLVDTNVVAKFKDSNGYFYKLRKNMASARIEPPEDDLTEEEDPDEPEACDLPETMPGDTQIPLPEIEVAFNFTLGKSSIKETLATIAENAIVAAINSGAYPEIVYHGHKYTHIPINEITRLIGGSPETNRDIINGMIVAGRIDRAEYLDLEFYCPVSKPKGRS